jgi:hypothetical protein
MFSNDVDTQTYYNQYIKCSSSWALTDTLYALFVVCTAVMMGSDFLILRKNRGRFARLYSDSDFYSQLSILQRKQWLAEEVYR